MYFKFDILEYNFRFKFHHTFLEYFFRICFFVFEVSFFIYVFRFCFSKSFLKVFKNNLLFWILDFFFHNTIFFLILFLKCKKSISDFDFRNIFLNSKLLILKLWTILQFKRLK